MIIRDIYNALEELKRQWYAGDIEAEEFAYKVFDLNASLSHFVGSDERA